MYLAKIKTGSLVNYEIRKSYYDAVTGLYRYRKVFELGAEPAKFIHNFSHHTVYFDEDLEKAVAIESEADPTIILEELLFEYLPFEERERINTFSRKGYAKLSKLSDEELGEVDKYIHLFDRRRLYYIRYGAVDQSRIYRVNDKLYRPLLYKSRDEKEFYYKNLELSLSPVEFKKYVFVIFNLQRSFSESFSSFMPEALEQGKIDEAFEEEVCRLNRDDRFWQDGIHSHFLRDHLYDYVIRFFDYDYEERSFAYDFFRSFRAGHRNFKWPKRESQLSEQEIVKIFDEKMSDLKKLSGEDLSRLFRRKAKEFHPDSGGEAEKFIQLLEAYEELKKNTV